MASRRPLSRSFWRNRNIAKAPMEARLLLIGLICCADKSGRVSGNPLWLRSNIFPLDDISSDEIAGWLMDLEKAGLISIWHNGDQYVVQLLRAVNPARRAAPGWREIRRAILERDSHTCRYCGEWANHVDHVIPVSQGGTGKKSNLVAACATCNFTKGGRTPEQAGMVLNAKV